MAKIKYLGHAGFQVEVDNKVLLFDPWIDGNPKSPLKSSDEIKRADFVFVSHDHADHGLPEAVKFSKKLGATFVGMFDLVEKVKKQGVEKAADGNIGGLFDVDGLKVALTEATHSCDVSSPCGFIVKTSKLTFYHAGDTGLMEEMKQIGELYKPDIAFLPIGSRYTMGPKEAAEAVKLLRPKLVIPMHYATFPILVQDAKEFFEAVGKNAEVKALTPGEEIVYSHE